MGDSVTAGFGVWRSSNESRGASFSIGGDPTAITLATILKKFNPNLVGYSVGSYPAGKDIYLFIYFICIFLTLLFTHLVHIDVCYGFTCPTARYYPNVDVNNAAKSGAMMFDLVTVQLNYL